MGHLGWEDEILKSGNLGEEGWWEEEEEEEEEEVGWGQSHSHIPI